MDFVGLRLLIKQNFAHRLNFIQNKTREYNLIPIFSQVRGFVPFQCEIFFVFHLNPAQSFARGIAMTINQGFHPLRVPSYSCFRPNENIRSWNYEVGAMRGMRT